MNKYEQNFIQNCSRLDAVANGNGKITNCKTFNPVYQCPCCTAHVYPLIFTPLIKRGLFYAVIASTSSHVSK